MDRHCPGVRLIYQVNQNTCFNDECSSLFSMDLGVAQKSDLSQTLFIVVINDFLSCFLILKIILHAEDETQSLFDIA